MQRIVIVANITFVFLAVAHIGNVCSFLRSGQIYRLDKKQRFKNYQHVIKGVARNGGGEGKKGQPKINIKDLPTLAGAVMNNANINTLRKLIESGADVNAVDGESMSALHIASAKGLTEVVAFLMKNGADINQPGISECTPLMIAVVNLRLETVSKLLELGADISAVDFEGNSALHMACVYNILNIIGAELISRGADINQRNNQGATPLMCIAQQGHPETVRSLLELGADVNVVDVYGNTALHWACAKGDFPLIAEILVSNGANINQRENQGITPLMAAVMVGHIEAARKLLELGADTHVLDMEGKSALHFSCAKGDFPKIVDMLLTNGADINQRSCRGYTPLMAAVAVGRLETVRKLLELGADIHALDMEGNSALHLACAIGDFPKIVDILLTNGADINHRGDQGYTPLMVASQQGCLQAVIKLLDLGSEVDILSDYGESALNIARRKGHTAIAKKIERIALHGAEKLLSDSEALLKGYRSSAEEREEEKDAFMELYGSIRTLSDSSLRPVSWTELVLELRSGLTMDAEMEEREKLEDAMMQKAMVAALEEAESESLSSSDRLLPLSHTFGDDLDEVEEDDQPQEQVQQMHGDHMNTVAVDSAIQNIELSKQTLDWWKRAHGQYKDMFRRRMDSLTAGRRSYALSKRLQGSDLPLFESKLYGHRILWSLVKRDAVPSVLVWCVSTHNDVSRRIGLINRSFARMAQHRNASAAVDTVRWIAVADDEVLLDPFSNAPLKLFEARADELAVSVASKWSPPLLLSAKQREINSQRGSVLLLGRSGTGKTYYLVNRMQSDARAAVEVSAGAAAMAAADTAFRQLCVTRSAKLCELLKSLYRDGEENSALSQRADFRTLEQFISHMEKVCGATAGAASLLFRRIEMWTLRVFAIQYFLPSPARIALWML